MLTVRLAKRNSDRIENDIKLNRLKIHLEIKKKCDVLYHFHNALNLDVFLIWKFFLLIVGRGVPLPIDLSTNCAMLHGTK